MTFEELQDQTLALLQRRGRVGRLPLEAQVMRYNRTVDM
jgi:hypothetical protein